MCATPFVRARGTHDPWNVRAPNPFWTGSSTKCRLLCSTGDLLSHQNSGIERPFVLSPEEEAIAETDGSVFILGRSGTGKTTLCVR